MKRRRTSHAERPTDDGLRPTEIPENQTEIWSSDLRQQLARAKLESRAQREIIEVLRKAGWMVVRINGGGFRSRGGRYVATYRVEGFEQGQGFPDLLALRGTADGRCQALLVECKRPTGGRLSRVQRAFQAFAECFNIQVHVCRTAEEILAVLKADA